MQSLALAGCFHINLPNVESLSGLIENLILRAGITNVICDITNGLNANPCLIFNLQKSDDKTYQKYFHLSVQQ